MELWFVNACVCVLGSPMMYSYMVKQRKKTLAGGKKEKKEKK